MKTEILRILNTWAYGFRNEPKYKIVEETRNLMKMEGINWRFLENGCNAASILVTHFNYVLYIIIYIHAFMLFLPRVYVSRKK